MTENLAMAIDVAQTFIDVLVQCASLSYER